MMDLAANVKVVLDTITLAKKACPHQQTVKPIGVTKSVDIETTQALIAQGIYHLGENRVDQLLAKKAALQDDSLVWHFIGSLQRRKVKTIINAIDYLHSLDSIALAQEIERRATKEIKCFLQVNLSREASKHGFLREELDAAVSAINALSKIKVVGLMTMADRKSVV